MFKYELHLHTDESSYCGKISAIEQVRNFKSRGYAGICVSDHFHREYYEKETGGADWRAFIDYHLRGYRLAKAEGDKIGLDVILGTEIRFPENDNDFLLFGIDEQWLADNPCCFDMGLPAFYERYHNDILIVQAHPFRHNDEVLCPYIHGIEIANCNPRNDNRNDLALNLAVEHPELLRLCGADCHREEDWGLAGVLFNERVTDSFAMRKALMENRFSLWCPACEDILRASEEDRKNNKSKIKA